MYEVAVNREFDAFHSLVGRDWGKENRPHSHHYKVEMVVAVKELDEFGFVLDISIAEQIMDDLVKYFQGKMLNDLREFEGLNPSIEHFCRIWCHALLTKLETNQLSFVRVRIWENDIAWARYTEKMA
jgi:6-pyruvoyltetrahydropterin/6-carboxytetrahydropterin synthase